MFGALPWWVYESEYEQFLAYSACAFPEEWYAGLNRALPTYVQILIKRRQDDKSND